MISKTLFLLAVAAALGVSPLFTGCATAPPADENVSGIVTPDPYQQQIRRQEAISRQQRKLMP